MRPYQFLLISILLVFCAACSEADKPDTETPDIAESQPPQTLKEINPAFHDVRIVGENGQDILTANFHALTPAANRLGRQEFEITNFLDNLKTYFPDIKPDIAKFTYYGLPEEQLGSIFTVEFDMSKLEHIPDLSVPGIHVFNYSTSFTKHQNERTQKLINAYCNEAITLDSRVCQVYANE